LTFTFQENFLMARITAFSPDRAPSYRELAKDATGSVQEPLSLADPQCPGDLNSALGKVIACKVRIKKIEERANMLHFIWHIECMLQTQI
jgi:hypothetical protein